MLETALRHAGRDYTAYFLARPDESGEEVGRAVAAAFDLLSSRVGAFVDGPDVIAERPSLDPAALFLADPARWLEERHADFRAQGRPLRETVILTTFGPRLASALAPLGFAAETIGLPAAPPGALALRRTEGGRQENGAGALFYIEAVDDAHPAIAPTFALVVMEGDALAGGVCGAVAPSGGENAAWIAAFATRADAPAGLGTRMHGLLEHALRAHDVARIDLGTQTAAPFYARLGYVTTRLVAKGLRARPGPDGRVVSSDLAMMQKRLTPPPLNRE